MRWLIEKDYPTLQEFEKFESELQAAKAEYFTFSTDELLTDPRVLIIKNYNDVFVRGSAKFVDLCTVIGFSFGKTINRLYVSPNTMRAIYSDAYLNYRGKEVTIGNIKLNDTFLPLFLQSSEKDVIPEPLLFLRWPQFLRWRHFLARGTAPSVDNNKVNLETPVWTSPFVQLILQWRFLVVRGEIVVSGLTHRNNASFYDNYVAPHVIKFAQNMIHHSVIQNEVYFLDIADDDTSIFSFKIVRITDLTSTKWRLPAIQIISAIRDIYQ